MFDRDLLGREVRRDLGGATLDQTWDQLGQLTDQTLTTTPPAASGNSLVDRLGGATPTPTPSAKPRILQQRGYTYAAGGDLIGIDDQLTGARRFELDLANRITSVSGPDWSEVYAYDPMGNITRSLTNTNADSERREYDGTLLTRSGRNRYRYDDQGRLVGRTKIRLSRKPETWTYDWDADDRMTGVRTPDGTRWRYLYDILGRRVAKRRLTESGQVAEEILFAWDSTTFVEETTAGGSRSWTHDGLRPIAQLDLADAEVDARFYAIITDLVGTPTELVTSDGDLAWHTKETLWGAPTAPGEALTPLRFPGQYADRETGLSYNLNRYYDQDAGRYVSQDPLGLAPAPNPGAYVPNPTRLADPLGLSPCTPDGAEAQKALPYGPKVDATWGGTTNYKHGGEMTAIEHINYRHAYNSGFNNVSHYAENTSVSDIRHLVDDALRNGDVSPNGTNGHAIGYDAGRVIGTDPSGNPVSHLQIYVRDGRIQTAFPIGP